MVGGKRVVPTTSQTQRKGGQDMDEAACGEGGQNGLAVPRSGFQCQRCPGDSHGTVPWLTAPLSLAVLLPGPRRGCLWNE